MDGRLIDRIYEAGVLPDQWPAVLEDLNKIADGAGALILCRSRFQQHFIGTPEAARVLAEGVAAGWQGERNPRAPRLFAAKHAGFLTDYDVFTPKEMDREPYFTEFLRPRGFGWGTTTAIEAPSGDLIAFDVERTYERGPVERSVVEQLGRNLRIVAANPSLQAMMPAVVQDRSIAECKTVETIAGSLGPSRETVCSHLKAVLAKTGAPRQVDLAALLACVRLPNQ